VVTDSTIIYNEIEARGGKVIMSKKRHDCGSDRIAEAVENLDIDVVINVQGDEPFIDKVSLEKLIAVFKADKAHTVDLASLMVHITDTTAIENPNVVKVIVDQNNFALYFSRSPIPYPRDENAGVRYFKHKGIYAFRKQAILDFHRLPMLALEASEKIECIRYLEYGKRIKMVETTVESVGIDTPEDLEQAKQLWK
jgi:3-deoxy-manno-octulosonate cytidylyltransferase (CMP-KDO synthetase)